jgi:hypothetical protein
VWDGLEVIGGKKGPIPQEPFISIWSWETAVREKDGGKGRGQQTALAAPLTFILEFLKTEPSKRRSFGCLTIGFKSAVKCCLYGN